MPEFTRSLITPSLAARFWTKVDTSGGPKACWPWLGARMPETDGHAGPHGGYGRLSVQSSDGEKFVEYTHRIVFVMFNAEPIGEQWVLHICDNPRCCNPTHIYLGDAKQNARDREQRQRRRRIANLSKDQQSEICQRYVSGELYRDIAAHFGTTNRTVTSVLRSNGVGAMRIPRSTRQEG